MNATSLFLLGSAESLSSRPLANLLDEWRAAGIHVLTHEYDETRSDDDLLEEFCSALALHCETRGLGAGKVAIAGFSRGARLAAMVAQRGDVLALLCLGFPFHKRGAPHQRHGLKALADLQLPTLIVQGSRDAHGSWQEIRGYAGLPTCIKLHWLEDGNHRWQPRENSERKGEELLQSASAATIEFLRGALHLARDD